MYPSAGGQGQRPFCYTSTCNSSDSHNRSKDPSFRQGDNTPSKEHLNKSCNHSLGSNSRREWGVKNILYSRWKQALEQEQARISILCKFRRNASDEPVAKTTCIQLFIQHLRKVERLTPIRRSEEIYVICLAVQSCMLQGDSPHTEMYNEAVVKVNTITDRIDCIQYEDKEYLSEVGISNASKRTRLTNILILKRSLNQGVRIGYIPKQLKPHLWNLV